MKRRPFAVAAILVATSLLCGATWLSWAGRRSATEPPLLAVEGTVLVNGEPAQNVNVAFHPLANDEHAFCPVGRTDRSGVFHLTTHTGVDGAPAGEYRVTFVWPDDSIEYDECECPDPTLHDRLKGMYARTDLSEFRVRVDAAESSLRFHLWRPRSDDPVQ